HGGAPRRVRPSPVASPSTSRWKPSCARCSVTRCTKRSRSTSTPGSAPAPRRCRIPRRGRSRSAAPACAVRESPGATDVADLPADLEAEHRELHDVVAALSADDWLTPTPAWGWDVRDTIAHLADTDELAIGTATGGEYALNTVAARAASSEDVTFQGVLRGRRLPGAEVGAWRDRSSTDLRATLGALPVDARVPWGIGMRTPSFVTARLIE